LTKQETIDAIKEYYETFKTGSFAYAEANGKAIAGSDNYTKFTANYYVEITNCKFKMSFDVYNLNNNEIKNTTTIQLNLNDVKSLKKGKKEQLKLKQGVIEVLNRTIIFQMMKNKKINVCQKFKDKTIQKELSHFEIKIVPHYDAYPNQKQPDFIDDLMVNYFNNIIALCKNESIGITTN
jgi:hypothetical protein